MNPYTGRIDVLIDDIKHGKDTSFQAWSKISIEDLNRGQRWRLVKVRGIIEILCSETIDEERVSSNTAVRIYQNLVFAMLSWTVFLGDRHVEWERSYLRVSVHVPIYHRQTVKRLSEYLLIYTLGKRKALLLTVE